MKEEILRYLTFDQQFIKKNELFNLFKVKG